MLPVFLYIIELKPQRKLFSFYMQGNSLGFSFFIALSSVLLGVRIQNLQLLGIGSNTSQFFSLKGDSSVCKTVYTSIAGNSLLASCSHFFFKFTERDWEVESLAKTRELSLECVRDHYCICFFWFSWHSVGGKYFLFPILGRVNWDFKPCQVHVIQVLALKLGCNILISILWFFLFLPSSQRNLSDPFVAKGRRGILNSEKERPPLCINERRW